MATNHMNGVAANGNAEHKLSGRQACEMPLVEIEALSIALHVLGSEVDTDKFGVRLGEAVSTLAWMIRERTLLIDRNLFPDGPAFDENAKDGGDDV
jgi:hypothetical protein